MIWRVLFRLLMIFVAPIVLFIPTLYAAHKNISRLPWGLDPIFGCREDGWDGTGRDPDHPRQYWKNVDGKTIQGWWPDHLGLIWSELSFIKRWWLSYRWCAFRNVCWNLRLSDWFGISIHYQDINVYQMQHSDSKKARVTYRWSDKKGRSYWMKRRKILGVWFEYGWEFHPQFFDPNDDFFYKVRKVGYTFDVAPFKNRSIPSFRPRF